MADNLSQKSPKPGEKTKLTNAINRTTSETMRLGEPEKTVSHPTSLASATPSQRKKTPAFQITSVTVGPRISNDGGDDSADDLDESHTDDFSDVLDTSRITDIENETPSFSEDTFSKEDVFFNATAASLGTAPVIPTSSQYGLAIVTSEGEVNNPSAPVTNANSVSGSSDVHVSVTESGNVINIVSGAKQNETEMRDVHTHTGRNERFKVVKIESTEPFKRGRWMCMDYLDHTMQQHQQSQQAIIVRATESTDTGSVQYMGADSGVVLTDGLGMQHGGEDQFGSEPQQQPATNVAGAQTMPTPYTTVSPGQTLQQVPMPTNQHQSLQPQQMMQQGTISDQSNPHSVNQQVVNQQQIPQNPAQPMVATPIIPQQHHTQSMSQVPMQQTIPVPQQVVHHQSMPPQQIQQAMTAAANMQKLQQQQQQNMVGSHTVIPQHLPQGFVPQQYDQQSMMAAAQGMQHLQPQQYYAATSMGVPVSGIQLIPQASISAQTQANPPATSVHSIPTMVGAAQQPITSLPIQVSAHPIPVGVSISNTTAGISLPVSMAQSLPMQQIPVTAPAQIITPQQLTPQQQQQIQHQLLAQQQMQQKIAPQPQLVPQQQMGQQMSAPQQQMGTQVPQQQMGTQVPQQIPQQQMGTQVPQQIAQQQMGPQVPQQQLPQQQMATQVPQQIPQQQVATQVQQQIQQQQIGTQVPQQQMGPRVPQQIPQQQLGSQVPQQISQQQMDTQVPQQIQQQQMGSQMPQQPMGATISQQMGVQPSQQIPVQQHMSSQPQQMTSQPQQGMAPKQQMPQQQPQPQLSMQQQIPSQPPQPIQHQVHIPTPQSIAPQMIPVSTPNMQAPPQVHRQLPLLPNQQHVVQTIPVDSNSTIPASTAVFSSSITSASNQTFAPMVTSSSIAAPMVSVHPQQVTAPNVIGMSVNSVVGSVVGKVGSGVSNVIDPNTGNIVGTVNTPKESQQEIPGSMGVDPIPDATPAIEEASAAPASSGEDAESASGTSAVAIDNKIEQAMDLVKSHLMFAVREEVEVLKEKIAELMDRINQLELENTILKAHASQETLAQLSGNNPQQQGSNKNQQSQPPSNGSVS